MYISCNGNVSAACHREVNIKGLQLTAIFYQTKRSKNIMIFKLRCTQVSLRMFFFRNGISQKPLNRPSISKRCVQVWYRIVTKQWLQYLYLIRHVMCCWLKLEIKPGRRSDTNVTMRRRIVAMKTKRKLHMYTKIIIETLKTIRKDN